MNSKRFLPASHFAPPWIPFSLRLMIAGALLLSGIPLTLRAAEFRTPTAITNITIVPKPGAKISHGSIVMAEGRILAAGETVAIPVSAEILDGTGLWAYAGFIDAASHLGIAANPPDKEAMERLTDIEQDVREGPRTRMRQANRNGIWAHRTVADVYVADESKQESCRKTGITTALVTPFAGILGGQGDVLQLSGIPLRSAVIAPHITQYVSPRGSGRGSGLSGYPVSRMGVAALIRQTFLDAEWYRQRQSLYERHPDKLARVPFDPVLDAMSLLLDRRQLCLVQADEADEIHHAIDLADELDQRIAILGGSEAWRVIDRLAKRKIPVIASLDWQKKPALAPTKSDSSKPLAKTSLTASWNREWEDQFFEPLGARRERVREWKNRVANIQRLSEAGIVVGVTSRGLKSPDLLLKNARDAMELGLSADQLLAALTTAPALLFGLDRQLGAIAPGKIANLTLMTSSLDDKDGKARYVFIDGKKFEYAIGKKTSDKDETTKAKGEKENEVGESEQNGKEPSEPPVDEHPWEFETAADRARPIQTGGNLFVKNATLLTVTRGVLEEADLVIVGGRIQAVGRDLQPPEGVVEIDLTGYWVMPGIIDPHSHLAVRGVNEGSQSITCEVRQSDVVDHTQLGIHRALAGGVTTIHSMHGSANSIGGQNAVLKLKFDSSPGEMLVTSGPRIVKFALGENVTRARTQARFPNSRMGVESVMRHAFNAALEYEREWRDYAEGKARGEPVEIPRRDLRLEALTEILSGRIWVHSHCYRGDEILRLLAVARDYGFRVATLQHVLEGYRVLPEMWNHGVAGSTFSDWWSYKKEAYDAIPYNASMMMKAGIVSSLNSDSGEVIRHLNLEAGKMLRFGGLTADEAIRLITINPAIQIGLDGRIGSIEKGKDGDLAVFARHPLDTHARNVMTVIEGEIYFADRSLDLESMKPGPGSRWVPVPPRPLLDISKSDNGRYAIIGATVHPVSSEAIENGVVVIEDGLIRSVGKAGTMPPEMTVVDASGLHVYPGLINAASQLGVSEISAIPATVDSRELARYQPELKAISAVNPHSEHLPVVVCEGTTAAHVVPGGGIISGRAGVIQTTGWSMPEMLREEETGLTVNLPSLPSELGDEGREKRLNDHEKRIREIEEYFRKAGHYAKVKESNGSAFVRDLRLEAMVPYVSGHKRVFFRASGYKEILEAIRFAEVFDLRIVILGGGEAWKAADKLAEKKIPVIVTEILDVPGSRFERGDALYQNAARLEEAGVTFCIATDGAQFARQLALHAGVAVAHGLSKERAIRAITLDAAEILGVSKRMGSLEEGKIADVIITSGDPTQASTRTVGCFIAGDPVELTSLHERNFQKFSRRPKPDLAPTGELRGPKPMRVR